MNKAFTKTKIIELSSNWNLTPDSDNGVVLTFTQNRKKEDKKTGELIDFLFEEKFYYPRIAQALRHYAHTTINNTDSLMDIINKAEMVYVLIQKLDKEFKQF